MRIILDYLVHSRSNKIQSKIVNIFVHSFLNWEVFRGKYKIRLYYFWGQENVSIWKAIPIQSVQAESRRRAQQEQDICGENQKQEKVKSSNIISHQMDGWLSDLGNAGSTRRHLWPSGWLLVKAQRKTTGTTKIEMGRVKEEGNFEIRIIQKILN